MELWRTKLELPADSVEFCPNLERDGIFVVGTYKLNEETRNRSGGIVTFRRNADVCERVASFPVPGVLDLKWFGDKLGVALSNGAVQIRRLLAVEGPVEIPVEAETEPSQQESLALALSWNLSDAGKVAASYSNGDASVLQLTESNLEVLSTFHCHGFEVWALAWDPFQQHILYTGGDDCILKAWDARTSEPTRTIRKHTMGVTAILPHTKLDHLLASGSYDETVFFWDTRTMRVPLSQAAVGGGVWRLKWSPYDPELLAVAAMHGGACILRYSFDSQTSKLLDKFTNHESMVYGIDWADKNTLVSCSFYDQSLRLWKANL